MASQESSAITQLVVNLPYLTPPAYNHVYNMLSHMQRHKIYERFFSCEFLLKHNQVEIYCNYDEKTAYALREFANLAWNFLPDNSYKKSAKCYRRYCSASISPSFIVVSFFNWTKSLIAQVKFKTPSLNTTHDLLSIISEAHLANELTYRPNNYK